LRIKPHFLLIDLAPHPVSPVNAVSEDATEDVKEMRIRKAPMTLLLDMNRLSIDFDLWF